MRGLLPGASPGEELQTKHVPHSASHHHLKKQETDTWRVFPLILFPQIIESNAKWEKAKEGENFQQKKKIIRTGIWQSALSNLCQRKMG